MKKAPPPSGPPPKASTYSRFIPREELNSFEAWNPGNLAGGEAAGAPSKTSHPGLRRATDKSAAKPDVAEELAAQWRAVRQAGYQDGYRDGLVALESFKQSFASQMSAQIGMLMQSLGDQHDALEQRMAQCLALSATQLARQIVRSELNARPELVQAVAREATESLLLSARHITLRVHPDDLELVAQGAADVLAARGARLIADSGIARGGCLVESDIGVLDATLQARWNRAAAAMGNEDDWETTTPGLAPALPPALHEKQDDAA
jgi:flagellar assembly protein FliH